MVRETIAEMCSRYAPEAGPARQWFMRAAWRFRELGLTTCGRLFNAYDDLSRREKFVAITIFMRQTFRRAIPLLLGEVVSDDLLLSGAAGGGLAVIGGDAVMRRVIRLLDEGDNTEVQRAVLTGTLSMMFHVQNEEARISKLRRILDDTSDCEGCRTSAAEGLGRALLSVDRRSRVYRDSIRSLLSHLSDRSPDVRACIIAALGELRERKAIVHLKRMQRYDHDKCSLHAEVRGGWTVSLEANKALVGIQAKCVSGKRGRESKRDQGT